MASDVELDDEISEVSNLINRASRINYIRDERARRKHIIQVKLTAEERDYLKEAAAACNRSTHSWCQVTLLQAAVRVREAAIKEYESGNRRRARTGVVPIAPIIPTDQY